MWPKYNFPLPIEFYPQNLVVLNMPNSKIGPEKLFKPSVRHVEVKKCPSLDPQSSNRLLNQFGEILGILPNRVHEGAGSNMLIQCSDSKPNYLVLPGTEIPGCLKFNHQSFGNSVSFWLETSVVEMNIHKWEDQHKLPRSTSSLKKETETCWIVR
ncbi:hypothetical protein CMV_018944 [Castanea mollissima]|uniref:Uncharacterized protein n=1 Tax=Castanea mollissima TaxID=60419 RepID=A0A8J4VN90_9ROSI|nr:hypothetical protein CMV_018944 [Castanea mollissima]